MESGVLSDDDDDWSKWSCLNSEYDGVPKTEEEYLDAFSRKLRSMKWRQEQIKDPNISADRRQSLREDVREYRKVALTLHKELNTLRKRRTTTDNPVVVDTSSNQNRVSFAESLAPVSSATANATTTSTTENAIANATASTTASAAASASSPNDISEETATNFDNTTHDVVVKPNTAGDLSEEIATKLKSNHVSKPPSNLNRRSLATESAAAVTASTTTIASSLNEISTDPSTQDVVVKQNTAGKPSLAAVTLPTNGIVCQELKPDDMSVITGDEGNNNMSDDEFVKWAETQMWKPALATLCETTEAHYKLGQDTNDKVQRCEEMLIQIIKDKQEQKLTKMKKPALRAISSSEMNKKQPSLNFYPKKPLTIPKGPACLERAKPKAKPKSSKKKDDTSTSRGWKY